MLKIFFQTYPSGIIGVEKEPFTDTMLCPNSKNAILRSCGAGIAAADDLMQKNKRVFVQLDRQDTMLRLQKQWVLFYK